MNIKFESMNDSHADGVIKVFNYYAENRTVTFLPKALPVPAYQMILKRSEGYPAYVLIDTDIDQIIGFVQLSAFNPIPTFKKATAYTCFIAPEYTGKKLGELCLKKIEEDARVQGIKIIISDISSENDGSIRFHERHGFKRAGELKNIGEKLGRTFGIVYMQKDIA